MEITTIRLPESMKDAIEREAEERELSPTEYMRTILRNRKQITMEDSAEESEGDYAELEARVADLEQRVTQLERSDPSPQPTQTRTDGADDDVIQWVRDNQPVSRKEILAEFRDEIEDRGIKPDSYWRRHVRPELEEAGAEYTRNVGWRFE